MDIESSDNLELAWTIGREKFIYLNQTASRKKKQCLMMMNILLFSIADQFKCLTSSH